MDVHEDLREVEEAKAGYEAKRDLGRREALAMAGFFMAVLAFVLSRLL
jgi:hypothetical protein